MKKNIKIVGYGQIGKAVENVIRAHRGKTDLIISQDIDDSKCLSNSMDDIEFDIVLICIPYSDTFLKTVLEERNKCKKIMVFSTVPPGTLINVPGCCHCPIEGKHPDLTKYIQKWSFLLGVNEMVYVEEYRAFLHHVMGVFNVTVVKGTEITEKIKLLSTLNYGVNIEFARFVKDLLGDEFDKWELYTESYNQMYSKIYPGTGFKRYNLFPPNGPIGGHCVSENAALLGGNIFSDIVLNTYKIPIPERPIV